MALWVLVRFIIRTSKSAGDEGCSEAHGGRGGSTGNGNGGVVISMAPSNIWTTLLIGGRRDALNWIHHNRTELNFLAMFFYSSDMFPFVRFSKAPISICLKAHSG